MTCTCHARAERRHSAVRGWMSTRDATPGDRPRSGEISRRFSDTLRSERKPPGARSYALLSPHADYSAAFEVLRLGCSPRRTPREALSELLERQEEHRPVVEHVEWLAALRRELEEKGWVFDFSHEPPKLRRSPAPRRVGGRYTFPTQLDPQPLQELSAPVRRVHGNQSDLRRYVGQRRIRSSSALELSDQEIDDGHGLRCRKQTRRYANEAASAVERAGSGKLTVAHELSGGKLGNA